MADDHHGITHPPLTEADVLRLVRGEILAVAARAINLREATSYDLNCLMRAAEGRAK